jgi:hypothetical protein
LIFRSLITTRSRKKKMATYAAFFHFPCEAHNSGYNTSLLTNRPVAPTLKDPEATLSPTKDDYASTTRNANGSTSQQKKSIFFRLPAELRNLVYKELLCPNAVSLKELAKRDTNLNVRRFRTSTKISLYSAILYTCRRIYEEAHQMLYTPHTFYAHSTLLTSMPHLCSTNRPVLYPSVTALITRWHICLRLDTDPQFTLPQATTAFSGAELLEIRVWQAQFGACDNTALKLFTGVRGVLVARVGGSVDVELATWLEDLMMSPMGQDVQKPCECETEWGQTDEVLCGRCYKKLGAGF